MAHVAVKKGGYGEQNGRNKSDIGREGYCNAKETVNVVVGARALG